MKAMGIDPGTKTFDLVVIDGNHVVWEGSIETVKVAEEPNSLIDKVMEAGEIDIIAGPSGYGVPVTSNLEIVDPYRFALEVLLLTRREDLRFGIEKGELGIKVYEAITKIVVELWRKRLPVYYIPSCILLPTIPLHRKINRLDMGTADKMAVAVLGVYDQSRRYDLDYHKVNFVLVELGFGYNAVIGVQHGRIVDGLGGTLVPTGFLTIGPIDAELAVLGHRWLRSDVFHGGVAEICGTIDIDEILERYQKNERPYSIAIAAMLENIERSVRCIAASLKDVREILLSGRYSKHEMLRNLIIEKLYEIAPVRNLGGIPGSKISKEAAQGYAIVGDGLHGGFFSNLVKHMKIDLSRGTVLDWVFHPRLKNAKKWLLRAYKGSVKNPKLVKFKYAF